MTEINYLKLQTFTFHEWCLTRVGLKIFEYVPFHVSIFKTSCVLGKTKTMASDLLLIFLMPVRIRIPRNNANKNAVEKGNSFI